MCSSSKFALKTSEKGPGHLQIYVARLAAFQEFLFVYKNLPFNTEKMCLATLSRASFEQTGIELCALSLPSRASRTKHYELATRLVNPRLFSLVRL